MEAYWYLVSGAVSACSLTVILILFLVYRRPGKKNDDNTFGSITKVKRLYRTFTPVKDPTFSFHSVKVQEAIDQSLDAHRPFTALKLQNGHMYQYQYQLYQY
ncbi:unnamed protein product [Soboliphyme baturini]|uniref:Chromosome 1 open reading frame 43 n=1 Tax=Soboliphyme baturini TaxID=241478 RepID=A0A183J383_9BILA|nr:unnamed protein product [Soboliphyme baturini]